MKKLFVVSMILAAAAMVVFNPVQTAKAADQDFRVAVTSVAGTVTHTFTNAPDATVSSFDLDAIAIGAAANTGSTFTVTDKLGTSATMTNVSTTQLGTANRLLTLTNRPPKNFIGDQVVITSSDTNTFVYRIYGRMR